MKRSSRNFSNNSSRQKAEGGRQSLIPLLSAFCLLLSGTTGCESLQKKFIRKKPYVPASPIVSFTDYTQAMTPMDRYRKHYAMFDYWHAELVDALQKPIGTMAPGTASGNVNPKRVKLAAEESLRELQTLHGLLQDEPAGRLHPLVEERARLTQQLAAHGFSTQQASLIIQTLDQQRRQISREWYWRRVEDLLKPPAAAAPAPGSDASEP